MTTKTKTTRSPVCQNQPRRAREKAKTQTRSARMRITNKCTQSIRRSPLRPELLRRKRSNKEIIIDRR